jgi:hypothetical protein
MNNIKYCDGDIEDNKFQTDLNKFVFTKINIAPNNNNNNYIYNLYIQF